MTDMEIFEYFLNKNEFGVIKYQDIELVDDSEDDEKRRDLWV